MEKKKQGPNPKVHERGLQIARMLISSGLTVKESNLPNKRIEYFRGDQLIECLEKNAKKIAALYDEEDSQSAMALGQRYFSGRNRG